VTLPPMPILADCLALRNVFGVVNGGDGALFGNAVDGAEEVFDYVFKLALALNDGGHALEVFRLKDALDEGDGMALGDVIEIEAFGGFGLDADLVEFDAEEVGDADAHFAGDGRDFGRGENEGGVDVYDAVAGVLEFFKGEIEEDGGVGVFPSRVVGREEGADVARGHCAEEGVGDGVEEDVAVGVAGEAFGVVEREAADAERNAGLEDVRVIAKSDANIHKSAKVSVLLFSARAGAGRTRLIRGRRAG